MSLIEPLPGGDTRSLEEVLQAQVTELREQGHPHADVLSTFTAALMAMDRDNGVPPIDESTSQVVADFLLGWGQAKLLRQLAALTKAHFVLEVGANASRAEVLARIGSTWPQDVPVTVVMDASLASRWVAELQPFVQCPCTLSLTLRANRTPIDESTGEVLRQILGKQSLASLSLIVTPVAVPVLRGLSALWQRPSALAGTALAWCVFFPPISELSARVCCSISFAVPAPRS